MNTESLRAAISRIQHLPPEYRQGLSNHLPMALHALHCLGADPDRLRSFSAAYAPRFSPAQVLAPAAAVDDWPALRGQTGSYAALRASFASMLQQQGRDATLRLVLPELWPGLAAAAFHGLIRTGHAVQGHHDGELAQALAYWAWRWQPVAPGKVAPSSLAPVEWTTALAEQCGRWRSSASLISDRIAEVQHTPCYQALAEALQPLSGNLRSALQPLAAFAALRYAQTRNFTVLHMVTACRAVLALSPYLLDGPQLRSALLRAYTAAYLSSGVGPHTDGDEVQTRDWPSVIATALQSADDHIVKLVHACRDLQAAYGDGPWLAAATRAVSQDAA